MTTRSTSPQPSPGDLVDAPAIHFNRLTDRQRNGESCAWCAGTADRRFPLRMLRTAGDDLYACPCCAGMYGLVGADR